MLPDLKSDEVVLHIGGAFRLTALVERRLKELVEGARPLVDPQGKRLVQIAVEEVAQGKIEIDYERTEGLDPPDVELTRDQIHTADFTDIDAREIEED